MKLSDILNDYAHLLPELASRPPLAAKDMPPPPPPGQEPIDGAPDPSLTDAPPMDAPPMDVPPEGDITQPQEPPVGDVPPDEAPIQPLTSAGEFDLISQVAKALAFRPTDRDREVVDDILAKIDGGLIEPDQARDEILPQLQNIIGRDTTSDADAAIKANPATREEMPPEGMNEL
jgi:hypothetical protein